MGALPNYSETALQWAGAAFLRRKPQASGVRCRELLWEAQRGQCLCCGGPMVSRHRFPHSGDRDTVDHVWPKQAYGRDRPGNVCLMHWKCNNRKGGKLPTDELVRKLDIINARLSWPTQLRWAIPSGEE